MISDSFVPGAFASGLPNLEKGAVSARLVPATGRDLSKRERRHREPLNVGTLGDVSARRVSEWNEPSERAAYLAVQDTIDESSDRGPEWLEPKIEEMKSLVIEHDIWDVVPLPRGRRAISTKWVVKVKTRPAIRKKARFTPRGFTQQLGVDYDETFAPVAKLVTLRIFLSLVAILQLATCQLDLKTAFLNATLEEEIYCEPCHDHIEILRRLFRSLTEGWQRTRVAEQLDALSKSGAVLKMKKACYGLKQAPRMWWKMLHKFLKEKGFKPNTFDTCFYVCHLAGGAFIMLLLYVDDIILAGTSQELVDQYTKMISREFRVSSEGPLDSYLGFDIAVKLAKHSVYLVMNSFVEKLFKRFKLSEKQSVTTPLPENFEASLEAAGDCDEQYFADFQYREKLGSVLYYMICMRPDLAYAVGMLAHYSNKLNRAACAGMTQLLQFCYNTRDWTLKLGGHKARVTAYYDSDWAGDRELRRSTGGFLVYLGWGPIEWGSKRQRLPAQSTAEAEFIAANDPSRTILWVRWLLKQTGIVQVTSKYSSALFGDNTASVAMATNPCKHDRTKHIALKYFFIRELIEAGVLTIDHVDTLENVADIGTKALGKNKFAHLSRKAMGHGNLEKPSKRRRTEPSDEFA